MSLHEYISIPKDRKLLGCMTLKRFQQLKRYIHVSDNVSDNSKEYFFNKLEPLFSQFVKISQRLWVPGTNIIADERIVMCYGLSSETVRMKHKPISSGYKIWALCDKEYLFDCSHILTNFYGDIWNHSKEDFHNLRLS